MSRLLTSTVGCNSRTGRRSAPANMTATPAYPAAQMASSAERFAGGPLVVATMNVSSVAPAPHAYARYRQRVSVAPMPAGTS